MTETEFRLKHSELIEYYQLIEMRLKDIFASLCAENEKDFLKFHNQVKRQSLNKLIKRVREKIETHPYKCLSKEEFDQLDRIKTRRNYWCHQCFPVDYVGDQPVVFVRGKTPDERVVNISQYADDIESDLQDAIKWDDQLTNIYNSI